MRTAACLCLLFLNLALAADIPAGTLALNAANQSNLEINPAFQYYGPLEAHEAPQCDGANYGVGLELMSCLDALRPLQGDDAKIYTFGSRNLQPAPEIHLPYRASSGEFSRLFWCWA